jgi:type IV secretory pathway ATPase VirB11/archaellum biosynthesis ATPase
MSKPVQAEEALLAVASNTKAQTALAADGILGSIQRLASTSASQIDSVIAKLTELRDRLQIDGERVQHEIVRVQNQIAGYMETNEAVIESVNRIGHNLDQFKRTAASS